MLGNIFTTDNQLYDFLQFMSSVISN